MDIKEVKISVIEGCHRASIPTYGTEGSAGVDLRAIRVLNIFNGNREVHPSKIKNNIDSGIIVLRPLERMLFGTGLKMEIPEGYELQIRPRSGIALKRGLTVVNSPGTIDSDYRGEVGIIIANITPHIAEITLGEAVAQGVLTPYTKIRFVETDGLTETTRGDGGYGHTSETTYQSLAEAKEVKFI